MSTEPQRTCSICGNEFSGSLSHFRNDCGLLELPPPAIRPEFDRNTSNGGMPQSTDVMTRNTTAYHDFVAFDDFRIVPALSWRKTTQRFAESGRAGSIRSKSGFPKFNAMSLLGDFSLPPIDLSRKLLRYIKQYNKTATPFRWRYKNVDPRIKLVTQRAFDSQH